MSLWPQHLVIVPVVLPLLAGALMLLIDEHRWRLKGHARRDFYRWLASWAVALRCPSDLGYPDDGFALETAPLLGLLAVDELGGHQVVLGLGHPAQQRPDDRGMVTGGHAQLDVAIGDARLFRHDADVCQHRHGKAGADRDAVDRGNDDLVAGHHVVDDVGGFAHGDADPFRTADHAGHPIQVAAGRERAVAGTRDHRHLDLVVIVDHPPDLGQFPMQAGIGRIHDLRAVDRDPQHTVVALLESQMLKISVVHRMSPI